MSRSNRRKGNDPVVPEPQQRQGGAAATFAALGSLSRAHAPRVVGFASADGVTPPQPPPAAAAAPTPAPPPPAPPAAAREPQPQWATPGESRDPRTDAANAWQQTLEERDMYTRRRLREELPQGETQLVHAWFSALARGVPPNACTIWITRTEPAPQYQLMIPGEAVAGEQPDRALYLYLTRNRRQAGVAETFHGRIRAPTRDGKLVELGGGVLHLPPDPALQQHQGGNASPWQLPPGQGWTPPPDPWGPPAWPSAPPPSGWGGSPPPWWGPPSWGGPPPWWSAPPPPPPAPPVPDALRDKPDLIELWKVVSQTAAQQHQPPAWQQTMMDAIMKRALEPPQQAPSLTGQIAELGKVAEALDKIRGSGGGGKEGSGISVTYVDDGQGGKIPLVSQDGKIDTSMTLGVPAVGAMRQVVTAVKSKMNGTAPGIARGHAPTAGPGAAAALNGSNGVKN